MTLTLSLQLTDTNLLQTAIALAGTIFAGANLLVNYLMLKKMNHQAKEN